MTDDAMLWHEARELARDALGDQAEDEVLLQEIAEQIYDASEIPTGLRAAWDAIKEDPA